MSDEVRVTNAVTGGQKGSKLARYDLVPVGPLREVAELYGRGAKKYADRNWELGYDWSLSYAAAQRHLNQWWGGESRDSETGAHHLASVIFHCMAMMEFEVTHPELDDRSHITKWNNVTQLKVTLPSDMDEGDVQRFQEELDKIAATYPADDSGGPGGGDWFGPHDPWDGDVEDGAAFRAAYENTWEAPAREPLPKFLRDNEPKLEKCKCVYCNPPAPADTKWSPTKSRPLVPVEDLLETRMKLLREDARPPLESLRLLRDVREVTRDDSLYHNGYHYGGPGHTSTAGHCDPYEVCPVCSQRKLQKDAQEYLDNPGDGDRHFGGPEDPRIYASVTKWSPPSWSNGHWRTAGAHTDPAGECAACAEVDAVR